MNLPRELKTIDEMINDRKLILGENSELFTSPQQEQSRMLNKVRPNNRIEFQIFQKTQPSNTYSQFSQKYSKGNKKFLQMSNS